MQLVSRNRAARELGLTFRTVDRLMNEHRVFIDRLGPIALVDLESLRRIVKQLLPYAVCLSRAAREIGFGRTKLRGMIDRGEIRAQRIGGQLRIHQAAFNALKAANGGIE